MSIDNVSSGTPEKCAAPDGCDNPGQSGNAGPTVRPADVKTLQTFVRGMAVSQMIGVACEAGLPNALEPDEALPVCHIAERLSVNAGVLWRLCRTLSSFGIFLVDAQGNIRHNGMSLLLRHDQQSSQHWAARFWTSAGTWDAWGQLHHAVQTGEEGFLQTHRKSFFDYMNANPDEAEIYRQYMACGYPGRHETIAATLVLGSNDTVVDVGGGTGALIRAILDRHPAVQGIVYDQPEVIRSVSDPAGRYRLTAGSFFDTVPRGGDVYILSYILHDWPDEKALAILRSCRQAMKEGARLIIVERLLETDPAKCDPFDLMLDMNMLVLHGGHERTRDEFNQLMAASGFSSIRSTLVQPTFSVFETSLLPKKAEIDG